MRRISEKVLDWMAEHPGTGMLVIFVASISALVYVFSIAME